ncbi:MAG: hypothetical protein RLZZ428_437 [Pseudomonadota bacterium]
MVKSPLRYPGGKSKAIHFLQSYIPHAFSEYREPFFGGGSVGFYIAQQYPNTTCIANDLNYELYSFWESLKTNQASLIQQIQTIKNEFHDGKALYDLLIKRRGSNSTPLQKGIDFFILNRITFSGTVDSGGYSNQSFHNRFTQSAIDRLEQAAKIIKHFELFSSDFESIITQPAEDCFIFLDPPYYSATKSKLYGKNGDLHVGFEHERLQKVLRDTPHKWLMTYDNCEEIKHLYKDFTIIEWDLQYGMNNYKQTHAKKGKELLIANYDIVSPPPRQGDLCLNL